MLEPVWQLYGAQVRMLRSKKGWSQQQLATALGYQSKTSISQLESGDAIPSGDTMVEMARIFEVTVGSMLGEQPFVAVDPMMIGALAALLVVDPDVRRAVVLSGFEAMAQAIQRASVPRCPTDEQRENAS
jgi:transcriptional regulator with XRE-family HTH domain